MLSEIIVKEDLNFNRTKPEDHEMKYEMNQYLENKELKNNQQRTLRMQKIIANKDHISEEKFPISADDTR